MVIDPSEIRYLKDKLFNILNTKMDIKELTNNMNNSNVDPEVKNMLVLMYSNIVNHRNEVDRDHMLVLTQMLEYMNNVSKEIDKIENKIYHNVNVNTYDNTHIESDHNSDMHNNINIPIHSVSNTSVTNTNPTKWYLNFKNIFLGGITFLPIIGGLTVIYSYNPEAAEKAVEVFFNVMIKILLPGV